ncbi:MAG: glycosyltransferase [Candidatus Margulisiibacteriota bacterium]|nr:glycosyltransferase [Candidatus Margulisiibacteriota bacterium]
MRIFLDLIIINFSAVLAFLLREHWLHFIKKLPSEHLGRYILALAGFNLIYLFISWLVGLYDKRQKRALLEEFLLILGIFLICMAVTISFLFLGRLWWVSRIIVYLFLGASIFLLCLSRYLFRSATLAKKMGIKYDLSEFKNKSAKKALEIELQKIKKLSVIIVTYNHKELLSKCLLSLKEADVKIPLEIVIVDNNSNDGTVEFVQGGYPKVKIIKNNENLGYSKAVNIGLRVASSEFYLIINPDILVLPGSIELTLDYMIKHPKVGIAGCKLFNEDGSLQFSARRFLDLRTYLYRFTPLRGLMSGSALERRYLMQEWDHCGNRSVDWVLGGCMLIRKSAADKVGLMDERFFIYFEDVDLCYRMWDKGWPVVYVGEAGMVHKHARTSANKIFSKATREHFKSLFYFLGKAGFRPPRNCPSSLE